MKGGLKTLEEMRVRIDANIKLEYQIIELNDGHHLWIEDTFIRYKPEYADYDLMVIFRDLQDVMKLGVQYPRMMNIDDFLSMIYGYGLKGNIDELMLSKKTILKRMEDRYIAKQMLIKGL